MREEILMHLVAILEEDHAVDRVVVSIEPECGDKMLDIYFKNGNHTAYNTSGYRGTYIMWRVGKYFDMIGEFA